MIGIYMFENIYTHKKYIGQSTRISRRKYEHYHNPSPNSYIDKALALHPEEFIFSIVEECPANELDEKEIYWIDYYDSLNNGYNMIRGGDCYRGENNIAAKLTEAQVKDIIELFEECKMTNKEIANQYNIHVNTIDFINRCKTWTYLHHYKNNIR